MADDGTVLVLGGTGQLGFEVLERGFGESLAVVAPTRAELDLGDIDAVRSALRGGQIHAVVNCAAYTAVDMAETEAVEAFSANALYPAVLAQATREAGLPMLHVSTDYVFAGRADGPYVEDAETGPLGVYGASKLAGELAVRTINPRSIVLRTAWVMGRHRSNFLKTMLRLAAERDVLNVVDDQVGCPTSAADIAQVLRIVITRMASDAGAPTGIYHFVNEGDASWADLATEILDRSQQANGPWAAVNRIATDQFPTPASRPRNSRLSCQRLELDFGIVRRPWRTAIGEIVDQLCLESRE